MPLAAGTRLGPYEILGLLGVGGMGEVYRARDPRLGREVAVKVLPGDVASDPERLQRFEREARAVAALSHPNVLTVFDVGRHPAGDTAGGAAGTPYMVTELLEGETLRELVSRRSPTQRQVLSFAVQVARGLDAAHEKGIVHRDLKPENVFVTTDGRAKVLDFGLAKLVDRLAGDSAEPTESSPTGEGHMLGTVGYMSPEQVRGLPVDPRTDIFSLGILLHELLSGKHPFRRETTVATLTAILEETPAELSALGRGIPPALSGIVARCLEKDRGQRFRSAHDLALSLDVVLQAPAGSASLQEVEERSPYPGLMSFTEKDATHFFGRETEVAALWQRLQNRKLLAVIGPSGAGKTSFLRAGVIAARPEGWGAVCATPGARPALGLAQSLTPELAGDAEAMSDLLRGVSEVTETGEGERAVSAVRRWRSRHREALLVIDQFEELFTLSPKETQERFAALLGRLASEADVHVVLSLRDDFLIRCSEHAPLGPVFESLTPLPALTTDGLRRALVEPAKKRGYAFEDEVLVDEMVESVEGARGALPLLAFAVSRLWERRDRERKVLTRATYEEIGGVAGALAQHAEATMDRVGVERQDVVREIFRNLVTAQGTRAVVDRDELLSAFPDKKAPTDALRELIDARLVTSYEVEGREGEPSHHRVEVVHESLLKAWPRLVRWQAQDEEGALLRDQLKQAAHLWQEKSRSPDLLWTGTAYQEFELWRLRYAGALTALEEDFARSMADRARRKRRVVRAVAVTAVLVSTAVAIVIALSRHQAVLARERAEAAAQRAEASKLLALGRAELDRYPTAALSYARKSLEVADTPDGRRFAVDALWRSPTVRILPLNGKAETLWLADFSPDGRWLAAYLMAGDILLVPQEGGAPRMLQGPGPTDLPIQLRFAPGGGAVVTQALEEDSVRMYSVPEGREIRRLEPRPPHGYEVVSARLPALIYPPLNTRVTPRGLLFWWGYGPDAYNHPVRHPFAVWPYDGSSPVLAGSWPSGAYYDIDATGTRVLVRRGDRLFLRTLVAGDDAPEQPIATLDGAGQGFAGFTGRSQGFYFGSVANGVGRLRVWPSGPGASPGQRVFSVPKPRPEPAWASTGTRVAWGSSAEAAVWVWDLAGPPDAAPTVLRHPHMLDTRLVLFAPDPDWLMVAKPPQLTFWSLAQPRASVLAGQMEHVFRLLFTRDSQNLLSCGRDNLRIWPLGPGQGSMRRIAADYRGGCVNVGLAPDGTGIAVVGGWGAYLAPSFEGRGRWLAGGDSTWLPVGGAAGWDSSGKRIAIATYFYATGDNELLVFDLEAGRQRRLSLVPSGETGRGWDWGVIRLFFTPEGRLVMGGSGGVRWFQIDTGTSEWIWRLPKETQASIAVSADGRRLAAVAWSAHALMLIDLPSGTRRPLLSHGSRVVSVGVDATGRTVVTGDEEGVVRVGPWEGGEPHRLCCHAAPVQTISVSPDGRWIASASGSEIRLWPMPDVTKPPLHTLPHAELLAKLDSLTNLRVVPDPSSATGWKLDIGPFPGWKDVPTW